MYSMSHTHRLLTAVCGTLCLAAVALGAQGLGRQPARYSAAIPATTPSIAPIVSEATSTSEPTQVTTPSTEPTPETTPETVPVTRPRPTPTTPRTLPPGIKPDESWASGACGGSLPPCWVMQRESRGNIRAINVGGCGGRGCYGKWQFDPLTSRGLGYSLTMDQYDEPVQDEAAATLWAGGRGCSHWGAC